MLGDDPFSNEHDPADSSLGTGVERVETPYTAYLCSDDVVALIERLDYYAGDDSWRVMTLDRTNDGKFYAFLTRFGI